MAIFRILYHSDTKVVSNHFKSAKAKVIPSSYSGDFFTPLLKQIRKNKDLFKSYQESTITHRVKRKKERDEKLRTTTIVQLKYNDVYTHVSDGVYNVFMPIRKGSSTRLQYLKGSIKSLLIKAREFNSVVLAFPLFSNSFDTIKSKDILKELIDNRNIYPACIYIYTENGQVKQIEKELNKNNIKYDIKELKS